MDDEMLNGLGPYGESLAELAGVIREQVLTGIESLTGTRPMLSDISFGPVDGASVEAEFADSAQVAVGLRLHSAGGVDEGGLLLIPLVDLGGMLGIETGEDRMADEDFAAAQLQVVAGAAREFFDLMSMTLFVDTLAGIEIVPAGATAGDATEAIASVTSVGAVLRIDLGLALPDGQPVRLVLLLPQTFVDMVGRSSDAPATSRPAPIQMPSRGASAEPIGLDANLDRITPMRPSGMFGAPTSEDAEVHPVRFAPISESGQRPSERRSLDLLMDVSMRVTVELGRSTLTVEEVLSLGPGSVVELNKLAGEPVDVLVNDQLIARGEVVVVDENFGVRVTEIVSPRRRAQAMGA
jgi:flagellar motor switch protein FliN/FliY